MGDTMNQLTQGIILGMFVGFMLTMLFTAPPMAELERELQKLEALCDFSLPPQEPDR